MYCHHVSHLCHAELAPAPPAPRGESCPESSACKRHVAGHVRILAEALVKPCEGDELNCRFLVDTAALAMQLCFVVERNITAPCLESHRKAGKLGPNRRFYTPLSEPWETPRLHQLAVCAQTAFSGCLPGIGPWPLG